MTALAVAASLVALGVALGIGWLSLVGVGVAVVGGLLRMAIVLGRTGLERERELVELDRRLRVSIASVQDVDPVAIGIDAAAQSILPGGEVPDYVPRSADESLRTAVARALAYDSRRWIVVAVGGSKVGKSRALLEALRHHARDIELELVAPIDGEALRSLITPGEAPDGGRMVLWLDDLEPFLDQGVTFQLLQEWRTRHPTGIVLATYGGKGSDLVDESDSTKLTTIAGEVFQHATEVPMSATTPVELQPLRGLPGSVMQSVEAHGLAAYLVAAPTLERKLSTGRHAPGEPECLQGAGLVLAAVDWARCGRTDPIPDAALRALWPHYLPTGVSETEVSFESAAAWACRPVSGTIALLSGGAGAGYQAYEYVVRLVRDRQDAPPPLDETWALAIESATEAQGLAVAQTAYAFRRYDDAATLWAGLRNAVIPEVAAIAGFNLAVALHEMDRTEEAIEAYDMVIERFEGDPTQRDALAMALVNKGATLGESERFDEALAIFDDVAARFHVDESQVIREELAKARSNKAIALRDAGRLDDAVALYDELAAELWDDESPELREQAAAALVDKGVVMGDLNRPTEELASYDKVIALFGQEQAPMLRERVAKAFFNKAVALGELGRREEELEIYDDLVRHSQGDETPELRIQVARALVNKSSLLSEAKQHEEALAVADDVIARFDDDQAETLRVQVAKALLSKGTQQARLDMLDAAGTTFQEVIARFADDKSPEMPELVATALFNEALRLGALKRYDEQIAAFDGLVRHVADYPDLDAYAARSLVNKGARLGHQDREEEEVEAYDDLVRRFKDSEAPDVREQVAIALVNRGVTLGQLERHEDAIESYDEAIARFGDDPADALAMQIAKALVNRGYRLGQLERREEAIESYDEAIARFGHDPASQALATQVDWALFNKGVNLGNLGRAEEAIVMFDEVVARDTDLPSSRDCIGKALVNKGVALGRLERYAEAMATFEVVQTQFSDSAPPELQTLLEQVRALQAKASSSDGD